MSISKQMTSFSKTLSLKALKIENCSLGGGVKKMQGDTLNVHVHIYCLFQIHPSIPQTAEKQPKIKTMIGTAHQ